MVLFSEPVRLLLRTSNPLTWRWPYKGDNAMCGPDYVYLYDNQKATIYNSNFNALGVECSGVSPQHHGRHQSLLEDETRANGGEVYL